MSTTALVDRIVPWANNWDRTGTRSILNLIQQGQDELLDYDEWYMRFVGTNKGFPPYLTTTAGTYAYDVKTANLGETLEKTIGGTAYAVRCRQVLRVFVDTTTDYDYNRRWVGLPYIIGFDNPYRTSNDRVNVADIPVRTYPALENTDAQIIFIEDPGTTTEVYFVEMAWEAPRLDSESIPLVVPTIYENALEDYVIGTIEQFSNGKWNERLEGFYRGPNSWITRYQQEMGEGAQISSGDTPSFF